MHKSPTSSDLAYDWNSLMYAGPFIAATSDVWHTPNPEAVAEQDDFSINSIQSTLLIFKLHPQRKGTNVTNYLTDSVSNYMDANKCMVYRLSTVSSHTLIESAEQQHRIERFSWSTKLLTTKLHWYTIPFFNEVTNHQLKRYTNAAAIYGILKPIEEQFKLYVKKYPIESEIKDSCNTFFVRSLAMIAAINPDKVVFNFTGDDSLYFRYYKDDYRVHMEVFYVKEDEDDNVEAVATAYKGEETISKRFGRLDDVFEKIQLAVELASTSYNSSIVINDDIFLPQ